VAKVALANDDDVIKTFPSYRADQHIVQSVEDETKTEMALDQPSGYQRFTGIP
jgi:hypothetical protein